MNHMLLAACTSALLGDAAIYAKPLTECMDRWQINTPPRQSAFLANVAHETWALKEGEMHGLVAVEENLYYSSPERLREVFKSLFVIAKGGRYVAEQFVRNRAGLSKLRYKGFHGRELLHLTWEENYERASRAIGFDYVKEPALVMQPWHACATACWFWSEFKGLNQMADRVDLFGIRSIVNGPAALGLVETKKLRLAASAALRDDMGRA